MIMFLIGMIVGMIIGHIATMYDQVVRCKDCKWYGEPGCAIQIMDDSDRPKETDFCSFGERKDE